MCVFSVYVPCLDCSLVSIRRSLFYPFFDHITHIYVLPLSNRQQHTTVSLFDNWCMFQCVCTRSVDRVWKGWRHHTDTATDKCVCLFLSAICMLRCVDIACVRAAVRSRLVPGDSTTSQVTLDFAIDLQGSGILSRKPMHREKWDKKLSSHLELFLLRLFSNFPSHCSCQLWCGFYLAHK